MLLTGRDNKLIKYVKTEQNDYCLVSDPFLHVGESDQRKSKLSFLNGRSYESEGSPKFPGFESLQHQSELFYNYSHKFE